MVSLAHSVPLKSFVSCGTVAREKSQVTGRQGTKQDPARENAQGRPGKPDAIRPSLLASRRGKHAGPAPWSVANE